MFILSASESSFVVVCIGVALLSWTADSCLQITLLIGHSDSGSLKNLGPLCQSLSASISFGLLPLVIQSAMLLSLSTQYQS